MIYIYNIYVLYIYIFYARSKGVRSCFDSFRYEEEKNSIFHTNELNHIKDSYGKNQSALKIYLNFN